MDAREIDTRLEADPAQLMIFDHECYQPLISNYDSDRIKITIFQHRQFISYNNLSAFKIRKRDGAVHST